MFNPIYKPLTNNFKIRKLAGLVAFTLASVQLQAADFYFGEDEDLLLQVNSNLTLGASWRLSEPNPDFIGLNNGGRMPAGTTDDGNLNFSDGDSFTQIIKGVHDLQLSKNGFGAFVRFKYWYDFELEKGDRAHGSSITAYQPNIPLGDEGLENFSKFSGVALLDAYVYGSFDIADVPVDVRIGRQVLSWGESTFIQGGMNSTNPFDIAALRRPGAELKEGILPVGMFYVNAGLTDNLSMEGFYQYEWEKTQIDNCGTLFSTADFAASGCNAVTVLNYTDQQAMAAGLYAERQADDDPDDAGQYGLAMRYYSPALNDTEFGMYYMNIHSRVPLINAIRTQLPEHVPAGTLPGDPIFVPSSTPEVGFLSEFNPAYLIAFPEDLKYYGLSFATNVASMALSGEITYKPDTPVQINGAELLNGVMSEEPYFRFTERVTAVGFGDTVKGYDEFDITQMQLTAAQFFDRILGTTRVTLIAEAGMVLTNNVEDSNQLYGRDSGYGLGDFDAGGVTCSVIVANGGSGDCSSEGYVTDTAWGYRMRAVFDYKDVIAGISFKPTISLAHDVSGNSPAPGQQFHEGRKTLGLALETLYQQRYTATLGYVAYSGGSHSTLQDKDYMSLSFGISY